MQVSIPYMDAIISFLMDDFQVVSPLVFGKEKCLFFFFGSLLSRAQVDGIYLDEQKLSKPHTHELTFTCDLEPNHLAMSQNLYMTFTSCNANCITGGSYFRITIALNYST